MKRAISVLVCAALIALLVTGALGVAGTDAKTKVMFLRGGGIYDWKNNTPILKAVMDQTNDFEVTFTENLDDLKERIKGFDIIAVYTTGMELAKEQEKGLCDFIVKGGGFVGIHSASDSFKNADRYWEMVGGRFA